jgi:hypothetical protein
MNRLEQVLWDMAAALVASGRGYALVGGLAISVRAEPRFTRDVDMAVAVLGDAQAEALIHELVRGGYSVLATVEHDTTQRLATARLLPPGGSPHGLVVDLLFASSGIEPEIVGQAEMLEMVVGLVLPVATVGHLLALKVLSANAERPQDAADLRALAEIATAADRKLAEQALGLIAARGFGRGKPLLDDFARLVPTPPP